jgi:predicted Zn-dependent protease
MNPQSFGVLVDHVANALPVGIGFTLNASGEQSDFVRFNHAKVRQPGTVQQGDADLRLIDGKRHTTAQLTLSGNAETDKARLSDSIATVLALLPQVPEDPHLLLSEEVHPTVQSTPTDIPSAQAVVQAVCEEGKGTDLVGIYAGGTLWRAFANHHGQRNWFDSGSLLLDYSLVHSADKAVKSSIGGTSWDRAELASSVSVAKQQLVALDTPSRTVEPGSYRAWLAPAAVAELLELMSMDGFSERAHQMGASCLQRVASGEASMDPRVRLTEDTAGGLGPAFQSAGFVKPDHVVLVADGKLAGKLVSPRSSAEYGVDANGASAGESPSSLVMAPGELATEEALTALGTGIWVSNLWYLNYSDRNSARVTGMTRFATFWVEDGKIVAPLSVMRFDASLLKLFGEDLEAIGAEIAFLPSASTYGSRSTDSIRVPGMLVKALPFTL